MLGEAFGAGGGPDKVERILALTERLQKIESAVGTIRYNEDLLTAVPEALKTLGAARDAAIAELKAV